MKYLIYFLLIAAPLLGQTTTPNMGLTKPAAGSSGWHIPTNGNWDILDSLYRNYADVTTTEFGADPTGAVDSSAAIQAAIDYVAGLSRGGQVNIPCGTYSIATGIVTAPLVQLITHGQAGASGGPNGLDKACVLFNIKTAGEVGLTVGNMAQADYAGFTIDNVTFQDKTAGGTAAGGLLIQNVQYGVDVRNVSGLRFNIAGISAPSKPSGAPSAGAGLSNGNKYVALAYINPSGETLPSVSSDAIDLTNCPTTCQLSGASPAASGNATQYEVYEGTSNTVLSMKLCQTVNGSNAAVNIGTPWVIAGACNGRNPLEYDQSAGFGLKMEGSASSHGLTGGYVNQPYITNFQSSFGTKNGLIVDRAVSHAHVFGGNFNLASNTSGCGLIANYGWYEVHTEAGGSGSTRVCLKGYEGWVWAGLDLLNTGLNGVSMIKANGWKLASTSSCTNPVASVALDAASSSNEIWANDNGSCASSLVTGDNGTNTIHDKHAKTSSFGDQDILIPNQKSSSGTRYVCVDTNGKLTSSAVACSGT